MLASTAAKVVKFKCYFLNKAVSENFLLANFNSCEWLQFTGDEEDFKLLKFDTAIQSSTGWDGGPLRAIDGNIDGKWESE